MMSPKQKTITVVWCALTMLATTLVSHGHMIVREIMQHWPEVDSWEGRLENALYTQGGLAFLSSLVLSAVILARGYLAKRNAEERSRRELAVRERHERAEARRHADLLRMLESIAGAPSIKKSEAHGGRPR